MVGVISIIALILMLWGLADLLHMAIEGSSMTAELFSIYKVKNELYQCSRCNKLHRRYQKTLYRATTSDGFERCPHCEGVDYDAKYLSEEKWMNTHPDCPKINWLQNLKIQKTIKQIKENEKTIEAQQFFEEYNKIKVDFNWIENLQKKYK